MSELHECLSFFLKNLYQKLGWNQQKLADEIHRDRSTVSGWESGLHRPNSHDMNALLRLNAQHDIMPPEAITQLFRTWLVAWGFTDEGVLDLVTDEAARQQLRKARTTNRLLRKELAWFRLLREFDEMCHQIELAYRTTAHGPDSDAHRKEQLANWVRQFIEDVLRRVGVFYDNHYQFPGLVSRGAVYTPTHQDANYLAIRWQRGLLHDSLVYNHWYGGDGDPPHGKHKGVVGEVYNRGTGEAIPDIISAGRFIDLWMPPRAPEQIKYKSLVLAPIVSPDKQTKYGVLVFDSKEYLFTDQDLSLITAVALLFGRLLHRTEAPYAVDYMPPPDSNDPDGPFFPYH